MIEYWTTIPIQIFNDSLYNVLVQYSIRLLTPFIIKSFNIKKIWQRNLPTKSGIS